MSNVTFGEYEKPVHWEDEEEYLYRENGSDVTVPEHAAFLTGLNRPEIEVYQGEELELRYIIKNENNTFDKKIKSLKISLGQRKDILSYMMEFL